MQRENRFDCKAKKFELCESTPHYPPLLSFIIDYMSLKIRPDFVSHTLQDCEQILKIKACDDINEIKLDVAEMAVHQVVSSSDSIAVISFDVLREEDKLIIKLSKILQKDNIIDLTIRYSAGYYYKHGVLGINEPRSGFHFITYGRNSQNKQAWTQGQAMESKYWFPCLDDPQVKFPREIQVIVPDSSFIVISNGELTHKDEKTWTWTELHPTPAYLTSVVIGVFAHEEEEYHYDNGTNNHNAIVSLFYYWPKEISREDAMLTFANTPNIMRLFEEYFGIRYPYKKYSQVSVEQFEFAGMENTNCTTLTESILHDKSAAIDYIHDIEVLAHELAHQWFGNLVTCKDWSNVWLNEGFATYFEVLYWESIKGSDEFYYRIMKLADEYLEESRQKYKRPLVTRTYKYPDELLDAHSYQKGSCILHMLRNDIGDNNLRASLKTFLNEFRNKNAETEDFHKIVEGTSRKSMCQFFDQWIYRSGHPELDIEFSLDKQSRKINIKIKQAQMDLHGDGNNNAVNDKHDYSNSDLFEFDLDILLVFSNQETHKNILKTIHICKEITENSFEIPENARIKWISIDPQYKILKEISSIKIKNETSDFQLKDILRNQLRNGKTVIERIESARALKNCYSEDIVNELYNAVIADSYYGVSVEAANTLGSYYDKNNYAKTSYAYEVLISCLNKERGIFHQLHPEIKQAMVRNIGQFERGESINILEPMLYEKNESYFVRAAVATAMGKSAKNLVSTSSLDNVKKEKVISQLKLIAKTSESFRNVIASGCIDGLKEFSKDKNEDIVADIASFIVETTNSENDYFKRLAATFALSKFLDIENDANSVKNYKLAQINQNVSSQLLVLLNDKRRKIKINACKAFADKDAKPSTLNSKTLKALEALIKVAEHDIDGFVRIEAERCANVLREWINEWSSKPLVLDLKLREEK
jgi:aminopeptidase N